MLRDIKDRGRTIEGVLRQYNKFVKKAYDEFIEPTMKYADIIIPYGRSNKVAMDFLIENIKMKLRKRGVSIGEEIEKEQRWGHFIEPINIGELAKNPKIKIAASKYREKERSRCLIQVLDQKYEEKESWKYNRVFVKDKYIIGL